MEEVKVVTVKASELGTNCWLPLRFFKQCCLCVRYDKCSYPEKVVSEEYERLLKVEEEAREALKKAREAVKRFNVYKGG